MGRLEPPGPRNAPPPRWAAVQASLSRAAGVALLSFDAHGGEIARAGVPEICGLLEAHPEGAALCSAWCGLHRSLAAGENRAFFYRCHAGLRCFALPLRAGGRPVGAVLGGRVVERAGDVDLLGDLVVALGLPAEPAERTAGSLPLLPPPAARRRRRRDGTGRRGDLLVPRGGGS